MVFKKYESESAAPLNNNPLPQTSAPNNNNDFLMLLAYVLPPDNADANSPLDTPASSKFECYTILCQNMVTQQDHMENPLPWWKVSTFGFILIVMGLIRNCHCARLTHMSSPLSLTSHATILPFLAPSSLSNDFSPNLVTYAPTSTLPSKQKPLWRPCA